jgi:ABC-type multidrug transport system ATPase subunit
LYLKIAETEIPQVNALLVQNGFKVTELSRQRASLEEVFMRLTKDAHQQ